MRKKMRSAKRRLLSSRRCAQHDERRNGQVSKWAVLRALACPVLDLSIAVEPLNGRQALVTLATYTDMACDRRQQLQPHLEFEDAQDESRGRWSRWIVKNVSLVLPTAGTRRPRQGPSLKHRHMVPLIRVCRCCHLAVVSGSFASSECLRMALSFCWILVHLSLVPARCFVPALHHLQLTHNTPTIITPMSRISLLDDNTCSIYWSCMQSCLSSGSISHRSVLPSPGFT
jgi:hypothetical protein